LRGALASGANFASLLRAGGYRLDLDALCPFARWRPGIAAARIFDTRFYLATAPDPCAPDADGGECLRAFWGSAATILADAAAGRCRLIFPTRRALERLAIAPTFAAARDDAARYPPVTITPWIEERGDQRWLCIPPDCGYPVTAEPLESALRG
ncbi:MAG TPA: NUDIX hydrolase, partial [Sphingomonadaceae bacterium]|nr:NUDIX hydrolase [Sphingomonadaceae bacterium]